MKKILLIMAMLTVLLTTGCSKNEKVEDNNVQDNQSNQQQEELVNTDKVLNMSFEERVADFYRKKEEIVGDKLRQDYSNVRLNKIDEHYEIVADLVGYVKIDDRILENAIDEIKNNALESMEIEATNGDRLIIYSKRPQEINSMIDNYYSDDWRSAKNENDWLNAEGIPMYVRRLDVSNLKNEDLNVMISKRDGEYYLQYRTLAEAVADWHYIVSVNEKDAVKIELLPTDKILLVTYDYYSGSPNDEELDSITVEEYYNSSPSIIKDGLTIDISNMSVGGYPGLDIRNGFVCVISKYCGN